MLFELAIGIIVSVLLTISVLIIKGKLVTMRQIKRANSGVTITQLSAREWAAEQGRGYTYYPELEGVRSYIPEANPVPLNSSRKNTYSMPGSTPGDEILKIDPKTWLREEDKRARREWDLEYIELTGGSENSRTVRIGLMQRLLRDEGLFNGAADGRQTPEFTLSLRRWTEQMWHAPTRTLANGATFAPDTLHPHDLRGKVTGVSGQVITFSRGIVD